MDINGILGIVLTIVFVIVGIALVWLIIEIIAIVRRARTTIVDVNNQLQPALAAVNKTMEDIQPIMENVHSMTDQLTPTMQKVDPLVDRVSLTVDAANLEIMRVDQILEDVTQITGSVSKTVGAVDSVTSAPLELVNTVTDKVRNKLRPRYASNESAELGAADAPAQTSAVRDFVDAASDVASSTVSDLRSRSASRKAARAERADAAAARESVLDDTASRLVDAVTDAARIDTPAADAKVPAVQDAVQQQGSGSAAAPTADPTDVQAAHTAKHASRSQSLHNAYAVGAAGVDTAAQPEPQAQAVQDATAAAQPAAGTSPEITAPIQLNLDSTDVTAQPAGTDGQIPADAAAVVAAATAALDSHQQAAYDVLYGSNDSMYNAASAWNAPSDNGDSAQDAAETISYQVNEGTPSGLSGVADKIDAHEALLRAINAAKAAGSQDPSESAPLQ